MGGAIVGTAAKKCYKLYKRKKYHNLRQAIEQIDDYGFSSKKENHLTRLYADKILNRHGIPKKVDDNIMDKVMAAAIVNAVYKGSNEFVDIVKKYDEQVAKVIADYVSMVSEDKENPRLVMNLALSDNRIKDIISIGRVKESTLNELVEESIH